MRRERTGETVPDRPEPAADGEVGQALAAAIRTLPTRMRAAVVLRHVEGLSVEETADALNCSTGTVKSQTARALDKLRATLPAFQEEPS